MSNAIPAVSPNGPISDFQDIPAGSFAMMRGVSTAAVVLASPASDDTLPYAPIIASNIIINQCLDENNEITFKTLSEAVLITDEVLKDIYELDETPLNCRCRILVICFGEKENFYIQTGFSQLFCGRAASGQLAEVKKAFNLNGKNGPLDEMFNAGSVTRKENYIGGSFSANINYGKHSIQLQDGNSLVALTASGASLATEISTLDVDGYAPSESAIYRSKTLSADLEIEELMFGPWRFGRTDERSEQQRRYTLMEIVNGCRKLNLPKKKENPVEQVMAEPVKARKFQNKHTSSEPVLSLKPSAITSKPWLLCLSILALLSVLAFPSSL